MKQILIAAFDRYEQAQQVKQALAQQGHRIGRSTR